MSPIVYQCSSPSAILRAVKLRAQSKTEAPSDFEAAKLALPAGGSTWKPSPPKTKARVAAPPYQQLIIDATVEGASDDDDDEEDGDSVPAGNKHRKRVSVDSTGHTASGHLGLELKSTRKRFQTMEEKMQEAARESEAAILERLEEDEAKYDEQRQAERQRKDEVLMQVSSAAACACSTAACACSTAACACSPVV